MEPFLRPAEVVVDKREVVEGGHIVEKDRGRFPATFRTILKIGFRLSERAELEVRAAAVEAKQPGIRQPLAFLEFRHRIARLTAIEQRLPFDQFAIMLQLGLELCDKPRCQRESTLLAACLEQRLCRGVERVLIASAASNHFLCRCGIGRYGSESGEFAIPGVNTLFSAIAFNTFFQDPNRIEGCALLEREIGQSHAGHRLSG